MQDPELELEQDLEQELIEEEEEEEEEESQSIPAAVAKKKKEKREVVVLERELGKSLLPISRVQKIIKADKDISIVAKDATFLISLATEEFIKRICEAGSKAASRENRTTVQAKDIATVVRRVDEFLFLEDILPWVTVEPPPKRTSKVKEVTAAATLKSAPTMLDQFVTEKP
ncbi:histone-fold-containing protein [Coprinopsis marcescibilis]|uniref:Histone-fold-containing protein n=1 Tax=Coprinopsis marcescibilis TaxID=230819 RepID=A0A5C3KKC1_COPMA|nr:histone-fold-containing protein [Coprinopsis marcescibilis]